MASHFDDLDRQHLLELHRKVDLLVKMLARQQSQIARLLKRSDAGARGRNYLRGVIREKREEIAKQKMYIVQLENELRLRGLE
jgi:hypothetical protein